RGRAARRDLFPFGRRPHREAGVSCPGCREFRGARAVAPDARGRRGAGQSPRPERQAARAGAHVVIKPQRLHREPDPRARRSFAGVTARLGWLMLVKRSELAAMAERQYSRTVILYGPRGPIVDRHGASLATSMPAESLFAQPRAIGDPVRLAAMLAPIVDAPE